MFKRKDRRYSCWEGKLQKSRNRKKLRAHSALNSAGTTSPLATSSGRQQVNLNKLESAKIKLAQTEKDSKQPPCPFSYLLQITDASEWTEIRRIYGLDILEVLALKAEVAAAKSAALPPANLQVTSESVFPPPSRQQRWLELNVALEKVNTRNKAHKNKNSTSYSSVGYKDVVNVLGEFPSLKIIPNEDIYNQSLVDTVMAYTELVKKCVPKKGGNEANRLYFISPIIIAACCHFDNVTILIEENLNGKRVKANGRFEMVLQRGKKRICIVEAKKDDIEQGLAQCIVGCEVASDLDNLDVVYGVVTTYDIWCFTKSTNTDVKTSSYVLKQHDDLTDPDALKELICLLLGLLA